MPSHLDDEIWDDLFHGCAWAAFIEVAQEQHGSPDEETTRRRAFALYEEALAERAHGAQAVRVGTS